MNKIFQSDTAACISQYRECIEFRIQFARVLWSTNKTVKIEYGLDKAIGVHIKKTKFLFTAHPGEKFSVSANPDTEEFFCPIYLLSCA